MKEQPNIFGQTVPQLQETLINHSLPNYTAGQICDWMYRKCESDFMNMSNISLKDRVILHDSFAIIPSLPESSSVSADGTIKYLFPVSGDNFIETVFIPDKERSTVCISTQSGCTLGCSFCQTGKSGAGPDLSPGEILSQILYLPEYEKLTNIVIMGMGEPLLNWKNVQIAIELITSSKYLGMSKKRITLSTVGIIPALKEFLQVFPCELAISMHSPFHEERKSLMPVENKYPLVEVIQLIRRYTAGSSRVVSFEYLVFKDMNHSDRHVSEIADLLQGIPCKINLLNFHPVDDCELQSPSREIMEEFQNKLKMKGLSVTIRKSRGKDIKAACGMLSRTKKFS